MVDASARKVSSGSAAVGPDGQIQLVSGSRLGLRMWREEPPTSDKPTSRHDYETVGYALAGRAELQVGGETIALAPGDSWLVPAGAEHTYRILETFTAVEAVTLETGRTPA